jgi:hypothetical protein
MCSELHLSSHAALKHMCVDTGLCTSRAPQRETQESVDWNISDALGSSK